MKLLPEIYVTRVYSYQIVTLFLLAACSGGDGASRRVRFIDGDPDPADVLPPVEQPEIASIHREQVIEGQESDFSYRPSVTDADADAYRFDSSYDTWRAIDGNDVINGGALKTKILFVDVAEDAELNHPDTSFLAKFLEGGGTLKAVIADEAVPAASQEVDQILITFGADESGDDSEGVTMTLNLKEGVSANLIKTLLGGLEVTAANVANAEQALNIFVLADDTPSGIDIL